MNVTNSNPALGTEFSREQLSAALDAARAGVWDFHFETDRMIWSEQAARLHGLQSCVTSGNFDDFLATVHPEDRERTQIVVEEALATGLPYRHEYRVIWPDGSLHWISANGRFIYDGEGRPIRSSGVCIEVTQRRREEEEERERRLAEANDRADRCSLTDLLNHRAFYQRLDQEIERAQREQTSFGVVLLDLNNFKFFNDTYGHLVGDDLLRQAATAFKRTCRPYDILARYGGDEFALLLPGANVMHRVEICERFTDCMEKIGFQPPGYDRPAPLTAGIGIAFFPDDGQERQELLNAADARLLRLKTGGSVVTNATLFVEPIRRDLARTIEGFGMLDALAAALDTRDRYTRRHSEETMRLCLLMAREMKLDEASQRLLSAAALLHDVGKIGVPDTILRKPGPLTEEEMQAIRQASVMGALIIGAAPGLEAVAAIVRRHTERWDGTGYPDRLQGETCPRLSRILSVANSYAALTAARPFRPALGPKEAQACLKQGAGTQWDPECVAALLKGLRSPIKPIQSSLDLDEPL